MSIAAILIAIPDNEPPADLEALIAAAEEGDLPSCILETAWHGLQTTLAKRFDQRQWLLPTSILLLFLANQQGAGIFIYCD
ncbi:hypothetical protein [Thermosynechococcus sp. PKX82]|uniref:hypothetical protein n=1 Tax=Thermosynechococcus sp. PKX82 TaxID=3074086 RepID=UPI002872C7A7|nr:hypothetical protein [Thermosynechococcus sp. PKX82]WNC28888.1 hypothetical protein RHH53_07410 [Thermosynechococcus sp. PKX82]